jgi:antirestriction protein ArdC
MVTEYAKKVAEGLIEQLKQGTAPWQKPWQPGEQFMPYNPTTGKDYRGGNTIWLMSQGHADPRWMTYRQATAEGAQIRKGEHGTQIQYWITRGSEPVTDDKGAPVRGDDGKPLMRTVEYERPRVKTFTVFNGEQIDGLPPPPTRTIAEWDRHQRAEAVLTGSGARIEHQAGNKAYYQPSTDKIVMPERGQFPAADGYYATAMHELGHNAEGQIMPHDRSRLLNRGPRSRGIRHNQGASRKSRSMSPGRYQRGFVSSAIVRDVDFDPAMLRVRDISGWTLRRLSRFSRSSSKSAVSRVAINKCKKGSASFRIRNIKPFPFFAHTDVREQPRLILMEV